MECNVTQGELIIVLRGLWRRRTGGKLLNFAAEMDVSQRTVMGWIAETQNPSLTEWAKMQRLAGNTTDVQDYIGGIDNEATVGTINIVRAKDHEGDSDIRNRTKQR